MKQSQDVCGPLFDMRIISPKLISFNLIGMNCEKNAVVCEGYHEKQVWKSGRERAEEGMSRYTYVHDSLVS